MSEDEGTKKTEGTQTTEGTIQAGKAEEKPSAVLVKIRRTTVDDGKTIAEKATIEKLLENGPVLQLPYEDGSPSIPHWPFPADRKVFEVPVLVADAAVKSGFFRAV